MQRTVQLGNIQAVQPALVSSIVQTTIIAEHCLKCTFPSREIAMSAFRDEICWRISKCNFTNQLPVVIQTPFNDKEFMPAGANLWIIPENTLSIDPATMFGEILVTDSNEARMELLDRYYNNQHFLGTRRFIVVDVKYEYL